MSLATSFPGDLCRDRLPLSVKFIASECVLVLFSRSSARRLSTIVTNSHHVSGIFSRFYAEESSHFVTINSIPALCLLSAID